MDWKLTKYPMYRTVRNQTFSDIKPGTPFLSKSSVVGNLIFLSGLSARKAETGILPSGKFEDQVTGCLENIRLALEEAGSTIDNLVKLTVFLKNPHDCPSMWKAMLDYYQEYAPNLVKEPPTVTIIPVGSFLETDNLLEIDSIAVISRDEPGWEMRKYPLQPKGEKGDYPDRQPRTPLMSESVTVGNLIFVSGMSGDNPATGKVEIGDFEQQMDIAFDKIMAAMDHTDSSASNIIKTWHLQAKLDASITPARDLQVSHSPASDRLWKRELEHYERYAPYLLDDPPGSTFLKLPCLPDPDSLVTLDIIGVINRYRSGWVVRKYPLYYGRRGFPRHMGEIKKYYANSVVIGNLVLISGQTPTDPYTGRIETDTFEDQLRVALDNLKYAVEETGSTLDNLVKTYILLPHPEYYPLLRKMEFEFYSKYAPALTVEPPASTVIQPFNLASPKMLIEIDAIACIPS